MNAQERPLKSPQTATSMELQLKRIMSLLVLALLGAFVLATPLSAEDNVNPGINRNYQNPDPGRWKGILERDGREVWDRREDIVEAMNIAPGTHMADIGAGTGFFTRMFAQATGPQGHVYAVDIAENFVDAITARAKQEGVTHITGVVNNQNSVNLPAESLDLAFISDTYHHFEYPVTTMQSLHSALRPGGEVVLIDFIRKPGFTNPWVMGHVRADRQQFTKEIESAGFVLVEELDFMETQYFLRFRKR